MTPRQSRPASHKASRSNRLAGMRFRNARSGNTTRIHRWRTGKRAFPFPQFPGHGINRPISANREFRGRRPVPGDKPNTCVRPANAVTLTTAPRPPSGLGPRSQDKIVGQKRLCAGRDKRRGGHFRHSGTKLRLESRGDVIVGQPRRIAPPLTHDHRWIPRPGSLSGRMREPASRFETVS